MDDDLKHKLAPRRNKRHAHLRGLQEEADWVRGLDWQHNDCHFQTLVQGIFEHLDDYFREHFGLRLDQLAEREELLANARAIREQFESEPAFHSNLGFDIYLHVSLKYPLINRAFDALQKRREQVEAFGDLLPGGTDGQISRQPPPPI